MKRESSRPLTGSEYLESIRDEREVWIYGERVKDVTIHPGFRNAARMIARMYDSLHDPAKKDVLTTPTDTGNGGFTHKYYKVSRTVEELVGARDAIAEWARIGYGWMGRAPDYKASLTGTLAGNPDYFAPYQKNALHWYREVQENCWYLNHALINPPVDKNLPPDQVGDVFVRVEKETDAGVVASGAKVVATGSALTHYNFIGFYGPTPLGRKDMALFAMLKMDTPGVKLICRPSYEMQAAVMGSPFDYPLSSRLDENDAVLVLDKVLIPWENLFVQADLDLHARVSRVRHRRLPADQGDHRAGRVERAHLPLLERPRLRRAGAPAAARSLLPRRQRRRRDDAQQGAEAAVGRDRHRVRRPPRALRAELRRQPREHPAR